MATELSNYDNDYRLRYRTAPTTAGDLTSGTVSQVGIGVQAADYNIIPLPAEDDYGMYVDGVGTTADPFENFDPQPFPLAAATSFAGEVDFPKNDGLGALDGRYSLEFTADGEGAAGFNITTSSSPPAGASVGRLWYDTQNLQLMVYVDDGTSTQWIATS